MAPITHYVEQYTVLVPLKYSVLKLAAEGFVQRQISHPESSGYWSAGAHPERLWNNGHHFPRKRRVPVLVCMLEIRPEISGCLRMVVIAVVRRHCVTNNCHARTRGYFKFNRLSVHKINWIFLSQ